MVATTRQYTDLLTSLGQRFPEVKFVIGHEHKWSPSTSTVYYRPLKSKNEALSLLHELSHALLGHETFTYDVELISKEVEAWQYAQNQLAPHYDLDISDKVVDAAIETYREWLYKRSICPNCEQTGQQTKTDTYQCLNCRCLWRVNDARRCGLKRIRAIA